MPNDITTLAIEIQSQEAERNLKSFYEMMTAASQTAGKMEKVSISMDAGQAIAQLRELRTVYEEIAAAGSKIAFDLPQVPNVAAAPEVDTSALAELKAFFSQNLELSQALREEMANFNAELEKIDAQSAKVATSHGGAESGARSAAAAHGEYAATLREVAQAQKEMENASAKADEAMREVAAADADAAEVKRMLTKTKREYAKAYQEWSDAYHTYASNAGELENKKERLKNKVAELAKTYDEAAAKAEKLNAKLEAAGGKADAAKIKYDGLKQKLDAMPAPMERNIQKTEDFSKSARGAATQATQFARGFNAVAYSAGASIPGLNKVGQIIGAFATGGPIIGGIIVGVGALAAGIKYLWDESQRGYKIAHEHAVQAQKDFQYTKSSIADLTKEWDRIAELESAGALTNEQNAEAVQIIEHLTDVYGDLGLEIDKNTRKLKGYSLARAEANAREREHEMTVAQRAVEAAEGDVQKMRERYIGSHTTAKDYFGTLDGQSPEEILRALEKRRIELARVQEGRRTYNLSDGNGESREANYSENGASFGDRLFAAQNYSSRAVAYSSSVREASQESLRNAEATKAVDRELELLGDGKKEGLIAAYRLLAEAKRKAGEAERKPNAEFNAKMEALQKQGLMIGDDGTARLLTAAEQYARQKEKIHETEQKISEVVEKYGKDNAEALRLEAERWKLIYSTLQYERRISQEKERQTEKTRKETEALKAQLEAMRNTHLFDEKGNVVRRKNSSEMAETRDRKIQELRAKIDSLLDAMPAERRNATGEDLLNWGRRFNPKTGKMDGEQKQAGWRGILSDGKGGVMTEVSVGTQINGKEVEIPLIVPDSTAEELRRIAEVANETLTDIPADLMSKAVAFAQKRIDAGKSPFFNGDATDENLRRVQTKDDVLRELVKYQSELAKQQDAQLRDNDAREAAKKQFEAGRKNYVYDKQGNIVREKTKREKDLDLAKEIEASEAKVKAAPKGSTEYYQAMQELDRLKQEQFKRRRNDSLGNLGFSQKQAHNNMVQGLSAKSSQALQLQTRNFSKPDNAWKTLDKTQNQIYNTVSGFASNISSIASAAQTLNNNLVNL